MLKWLVMRRESAYIVPGASPGFGRGGARILFFRFGNLHVASRHAAHGKAMRIARGVRGHAPPRKFLNDAIWCVLECILIRFCLYFFFKLPFFI